MSLNIKLIQESFRAIRPHAPEVIEHFYSELFERYPESKNFFSKINMKKQHKALINSLAHIVEFLNETDHLQDYLKKMGARHVKYDVLPEHYDWVGEALLATFEFYFEENWTEELKQSWVAAFGFVASEMIQGMSAEADNVTTMNNLPPDLNIHEIAKEFSHKLILKSMNEELSKQEWEKFVQEKISHVIKKAIEDEVKTLLNEAIYNAKIA